MATGRSKSGAPAGSEPAASKQGWTKKELAGFETTLREHNATLTEEIARLKAEIETLSVDAANATGDDQADTGSRAFERDHDVQTLLNAQELHDQNALALERLAAGTYGICEDCGQPIAKPRLEAFPGATLCVTCKAAQERR